MATRQNQIPAALPTQMVPPSMPAKLPKAGFVWAPAVFVITAIVGLALIVLSVGTIANAIADFKTVEAGQALEVDLSKGEYHVFAGGPTSSALAGVSVGITDPRGTQVSPKENSDSYSAEVDGSRYESIGSFDAVTAGIYRIEVQGPAGSSARIGKIPIGRTVGLLVGGIVVGSVGFVIALIILIVTIVRRGRIRKSFAGPGAWTAPAPSTVTVLPMAPPPAPPTVTILPAPAPPPPSPSSPATH